MATPPTATSPALTLDGSGNIFRAATGAWTSLALEEGDFPAPLTFGTWKYKEYPPRKVDYIGYCKPRWSADGKRFLFVNQRVFAYDVKADALTFAWEQGGDNDAEGLVLRTPTDAEFSPDGAYVFVAQQGQNQHDDATCIVQVDAGSGKEIARIPMEKDDLGRLAVHPDGRHVAASSALHGGNGRAVNLAELGGKTRRLLETTARDLAFSPDGRTLALGMDGGSSVLDMQGKTVWKSDASSDAVAWLADGRAVFSGVGIVDVKSGKIVPLEGGDVSFRNGHLYVADDGHFGATNDGKWTEWNADGSRRRKLEIPSARNGESLGSMAPDGRVLFGWNYKNKASLYAPTARFAVVTVEGKNAGDEGKPKQEGFGTRAEAEAAATKRAAGLTKKGFALAEVVAGVAPEARAEAERWKTIRKSKASKYLRPAWRPKTAPEDAPTLGFLTKARLLAKEEWPECPNCKGPMELLAQLDLSAMPESTLSGLLQVFYCTSSTPLCEVDTEAFFAGPGKSKLVRVVDPKAATHEVPRPSRVVERSPGKPLAIVGWEPFTDGPSASELSEVFRKSLDALGVEEDLWEGLPLPGDKVGGYPAWDQGVEYPKCPDCKKAMDVPLLQLASNGAAGWQWGDLGTAYVVSCKKHPAKAELIWQGG